MLLINPFAANVDKADAAYQQELLEIRHGEEGKTNFDSGGCMQPWQKQKISYLYPNMWKSFLAY